MGIVKGEFVRGQRPCNDPIWIGSSWPRGYHCVEEINISSTRITIFSKVVRIVLGDIFGLLACLTGGWPGWVRIVFGIIAVAFLGTAFVGCWPWKGYCWRSSARKALTKKAARTKMHRSERARAESVPGEFVENSDWGAVNFVDAVGMKRKGIEKWISGRPFARDEAFAVSKRTQCPKKF